MVCIDQNQENSSLYIFPSTLISDYQILDASNPNGKFRRFTPRDFDHEYSIDHYNDKFYIITNWKAKNNRLMETPDNKTQFQTGKRSLLIGKMFF
ncbi:MAG: hypothetical protein Ct9H90mP20_6660 [Candidatus Neomarinimicrobiota bacterium]|nr:MAG: hypothetical protein Ct9H90mP20_6660 [Candidatus Neomarinimicrobiota bacterium]